MPNAEHPWATEIPEYVLTLLRTEVGAEFADTLPRFVRGLIDRMLMSVPKYGKITPDAVSDRGWMESIRLRLDLFYESGNTEWLMDIANFMVIMSTFPCHPRWHFRSTASHESPGYVTAAGTHRFHPQDQSVMERQLQRQQRSGD